MRYYTTKKLISYKPYPEHYKYVRKNWFTDQVFKFLKRYKALIPYVDQIETEVFDLTPSKEQSLEQRIYTYFKQMAYDYNPPDPEKHIIVMGEIDFFKALNDSKFASSGFFNEPTLITLKGITYYTSYKKVVGFDVLVVPKMDGLMVLPRVFLERYK